MGDLGEAMENFWSGDMWAQLENMNNEIKNKSTSHKEFFASVPLNF